MKRVLLLTVLVIGTTLGGVFAQQEPASPPPIEAPKPKAKPPVLDEQHLDAQWNKLPVETKAKLMRLHRALAEMPPDQRKFIHDRIERFLNMSPADREKLQQNRQKWEQMSPEQRQKAREEFHKRREEIEQKLLGEGTSSNMTHDSKSPETVPQSPTPPPAP